MVRPRQLHQGASHRPKAAGFGMIREVVQACSYSRGVYIDEQGRVPECQALDCRCHIIPNPGERQELLANRAILPVKTIELLRKRYEVLDPPLETKRPEKRP